MWTEIQDPTKFYIEIQNKTDIQTERFLTMYGRMCTLQYTPEKNPGGGGGAGSSASYDRVYFTMSPVTASPHNQRS